jgi:hypothetical protein
MAATMSVYYDWGGTDDTPANETDVDALGPPCIRFKTNDDATIDTNNPIPIPAAGTNYSYWKQIYLYCDVAPSSYINNIKFYTDGGGFGTGIAVKVGDETPTKNSGSDGGYEVATGTPGSTGDEMVAAHADLTGSTDVFTYTSGAPKTVSISEGSSQIDFAGETSDYVILQMEVGSTASPGNLTDETFTFKYDEV